MNQNYNYMNIFFYFMIILTGNDYKAEPQSLTAHINCIQASLAKPFLKICNNIKHIIYHTTLAVIYVLHST